jgi:hypothetical protein
MPRFIDSRLQVDPESFSIDISEKSLKEVEELKEITDELNQLRSEMGRLFQILGNLREKANEAERDMVNIRRSILSAHNIEDGKWVLDFENNKLVKVVGSAPLVP